MTSIGGSTRRRGLTDIVPRCDDSQSDKSQISTGSGDSDQKSSLGCVRIQHLTGPAALGRSRFPKLEECAHFHYEHVELHSIQLTLYEEEDLKSLSSLEYNENVENKWLTVKVTSHGQSWLLRRTYENFRMLDQQLHQCIYDRKFSSLPELPPLENLPEKQDPQSYIKCQLNKYCERFSDIAGSLINCGPVLNWLQLDNRGRRILVTDGDSCPINTPAVAAAYAVERYSAVAADEISFDIGDMISVIDMPPPEDSVWWRGKRGFMVGFFPSHCVAVITDKVPRNLQLNQPSSIIEPSKPVLRKHGKLIAFFRAFILSRPSKRHLKQSGIFKERVFGCDLGEHLLNSGREVPMVLKCCSEFIEQHGIVDGIYRLSGATSNIQKLRTTFDEDRIPALYSDDSILQDIHSVASLLKMYFRELPNPLCTYQLYKNFVNAVQNSDAAGRVAKMREVVQKLPPPHFRTLEYLMRHLSKVAEHGARTGMTARNIAIVWAPNLLRCKELEYGGVAALQGVGVQAVVTEFLISNVDMVFSDDRISIEGISRRMRPKSLSIGTPTKLLSLEEAQSKRLGSDSGQDNYIEVGGGPSCLPKMYHTVIELPSRKRPPLKRSPLGWKSLFSRSSSGSTGLRKSSSTNSAKRKPSAPIETTFRSSEPIKTAETEIKTRLRTVKSAESLTSGAGNGASVRNSMCLEYLSPPSPKLSSTAGHSRSVSHNSYFDHLAESTPMHSTLRPDDDGLSDLKLNFDLDESEMKIFSEESSQLFSNTSSSEQLQVGYHHNLKKVPLLASAENTIIVDPSPKKHKTNDNSSCSSATLSDDMTAVSKKRSRLEEQLLDDDFAYIDSQCNDRLVVEVDVHHRESSQLSSPMNDTQCSENDTMMSACTMSDSTLANASIAYTPLSDYSGTTNTSSIREPSYQRLISSISSSQLPRSSTESVRNYDFRRYENVPRNRFSYHGDLRPGGSPAVAGNRLSLQMLTSTLSDGFERRAASAILSPSANGDAKKWKCDTTQAPVMAPLVAQQCTNGFTHRPENSAPNTRPEASSSVAERLRCSTSPQNCSLNASVSESDSAESAQNSEYENVPKLELILNDKEMFSDSEKNECPYELVTMVGNRMTSVPCEGSPFATAVAGAKSGCESNYEEIEPMNGGERRVDDRSDGNYEEMSAVYTDNDIYHFGGSSVDGSEERKAAAYEDVFVLDANDVKDVSSSNESLASSADEAMIENNLYESLVAEDSSPDPGSNRSSKIVDGGAATSVPTEVTSNYKNFVVTLGVAGQDLKRITPTECSPLITSDIHSPFSDLEPQIYVNAQPNNYDNLSNSNKSSNSNAISSCHDNAEEQRAEAMDVSKCPEPMRPSSLSLVSGDGEPKSAQLSTRTPTGAETKNEESDLLRSGSTKSVQDLVSKFEWSAESDSNPRKDPNVSSQKSSRFEPKRDFVSLPPQLRSKSSQESLSCAVESPTDECREGDDESVRRDRIERFKEERRLALRQKYQVEDSFINDQKDAEMIRRFKQKILKTEKADNSAKSLEYDSSLATSVSSGAKTKEKSTVKPPTPAVTTISILYTLKKRKESAGDETSCGDKPTVGSGSPKSHVGSANSTTEAKEALAVEIGNGGHLLMSKSFGSLSDKVRELPLKPPTYEGRRPFTASLERNTSRVRGFVKEESLVAKRVNQLSEASDVFLATSGSRKNGESGSMRRRAHSTSGPGVPYCIRDIAAIFENKDNK